MMSEYTVTIVDTRVGLVHAYYTMVRPDATHAVMDAACAANHDGLGTAYMQAHVTWVDPSITRTRIAYVGSDEITDCLAPTWADA